MEQAPHRPGFVDTVAAAAELTEKMIDHPWGRSSPSVYETGRLVSLAPWLSGQAERLRFLLAAQRPDGGWGLPHDGYALIPTLSATEALLCVLPAGDTPTEVRRADLLKAADQGLHRLSRLLAAAGGGDLDTPDMPAIEHIAPYLVERINARLDGAGAGPPAGLEHWQGIGPLRAPEGMTGELLPVVRDLLDRGEAVPPKLLHALEIAGDSARAAPSVRPEPSGTVGASPAATAAWLGDPTAAGGSRAELRYLETAIAQHGGPVPVAVPITEFERGWVLNWLARAGIPLEPPQELLDGLVASLGETGTGGGAGLPPDADTSSGALYALSLLGRPHPPDLLWRYETETHFCTWQGENGRSITTNAHVLEAFGHFLQTTDGGRHATRYAATTAKVASWLCEQQEADGAWRDRWHASPYYATACAAPALSSYGGDDACARAAERAVEWVLETQHSDGSWGRWDGTVEETAYAVQTLLLAQRRPGRDALRAAARGAAYLRPSALKNVQNGITTSNSLEVNEPSLWHDKDAYRPITIVRAAVLAALHLAQSVEFVTAA